VEKKVFTVNTWSLQDVGRKQANAVTERTHDVDVKAVKRIHWKVTAKLPVAPTVAMP